MRTITLSNGKEYPIVFDYAVLKKVQEKFGDLKAVQEKIQNTDDAAWIVLAMINGAIAKNNYELEQNDKLLTEEAMGFYFPLDPKKATEIITAMAEEMFDAMGGRKNVESIAKQAGMTLPNLTDHKPAKQ